LFTKAKDIVLDEEEELIVLTKRERAIPASVILPFSERFSTFCA
jgi:hypothetical protein